MKQVRMVKVNNSSLVAAHGFNDDGMFITFVRTGLTYRYPTVTKELYDEFLKSESLGKFFLGHFQKLVCKKIGGKK